MGGGERGVLFVYFYFILIFLWQGILLGEEVGKALSSVLVGVGRVDVWGWGWLPAGVPSPPGPGGLACRRSFHLLAFSGARYPGDRVSGGVGREARREEGGGAISPRRSR